MSTATLAQYEINASAPVAHAGSDPSAAAGLTLGNLFRRFRWRILLTYALFNLENVLRLLQPLVLGIAINGLLQGSYFGLLLFLAQHLTHLGIGTIRRIYDTRTYAHIYSTLATEVVRRHKERGIEISRISARSSLSRALVDFFEIDVPVVLRTIYLVLGACLMLLFYDVLLLPICLFLLFPAWLINRVYSRKTLAYSRALHDQLEGEVAVIEHGDDAAIRSHYDRVGNWRIRLSDCEAWNFGVMELFILAVLAVALLRVCSAGALAGDVFAVFRYVLMFVMGLDSVPILVQKVARVRDIGRRVASAPDRTSLGSSQPVC